MKAELTEDATARRTPITKQYAINDTFYSLQGEGVRAGTAAIFLRFAGCNLQCSTATHGFDCDTEFTSFARRSATEIVEFCAELAPAAEWIILTGGEPLLQADVPLCSTLKSAGYNIAIETNGTVEPGPELRELLNWITCSPKVAEHAIKLTSCDELKYVRTFGQGIPRPALSDAPFKLISPAFSGDQVQAKTLQWCVQLVKDNPDWRLSIQQHKIWRIP
jgi:organic radical activating enzyme